MQIGDLSVQKSNSSSGCRIDSEDKIKKRWKVTCVNQRGEGVDCKINQAAYTESFVPSASLLKSEAD